jgi:hypothetical protein
LSIDNKIGNNKTAEQNKENDSLLGNLVSGPADNLFEKLANKEFTRSKRLLKNPQLMILLPNPWTSI